MLIDPANALSLAPEWQVSQWFNTEEPLSLARLRGKAVVLHAFQMLCPGCVSHGVPQAERLHRMLQGEAAVAVVGLHSVFEHHQAMTPLALEAFLHEYRISHPVAVDAPQAGATVPATMQAYRLRGTPSLVLIDGQGRIRYQRFGQVDDLLVGVLVGLLLAETAPVGQVASAGGAPPARPGCADDACQPAR